MGSGTEAKPIIELPADATRLADECGGRGHLARVHTGLAQLDRIDSDEQGYEGARRPNGLFEHTGATEHAARIAAQLAAVPA